MLYRFLLVSLLLALTSLSVWGEVNVGFVELRKWDGSLRRLEPDFDYAHVAIQWNRKWVHAHPVQGVVAVDVAELEKFGKIGLTLTLSALDTPDDETFEKYLGLPYDAKYGWSDEAIYCSELVAKVLGIEAEKMHFDPALWPASYLKLEGLPGISPGGLYRALARQVVKTPQRQKSPTAR